MLQLPTGTDVLLGETLSCYVRLINLADAALTNIVVKVSALCCVMPVQLGGAS